MNTEKIDTVSAVSKLAGCPRSTIQSAIGRGEIATSRLAGGAVVVSVDDVRAWMSDTERRPGPKPTPATDAPDGSTAAVSESGTHEATTEQSTTPSGGYNPRTGGY